MKFKRHLQIAIRNIKSRALRSWLTILGVVIGIFLITSLISISEGLPEAVREMLRQMGGDVVMIIPGEGYGDFAGEMMMGAADSFGDRELEAVRRTRGVDLALGMPFESETIRWEDRSESVLIWGLDFSKGLEMIRDDMGWEAEKGSLPRPGRREVVVGNLVPRNILPGISPGDEITVSGRKYTVSGVLKSLGHRENDQTILFDLGEYRNVTGTTEETPVIMARVEEGFDLDTVVANIETTLQERMVRGRGETDPTFTVLTNEAMVEVVDNVLGVIRIGITALASVAIAAGAIGMMNTTYTAVKDRTKEVGVLKAVGAKRRDVTTLFIIESGIIGLIGGVLGVGLGLGASHLGAFILNQNPEMIVTVTPYVSFGLIGYTLLLSFLLGCVSGYFPARRAAKLKPIDALRSE